MDAQNLIRDKLKLFWLLQLGGWFGWWLSQYVTVIFIESSPPGYWAYVLVVAGLGIVITLPLRLLLRRTWESHPAVRGLALLAGSYVATCVWLFLRGWLFMEVFPDSEISAKIRAGGLVRFLGGSLSAVWIMLVWSALYVGIRYYLLSQAERQRYLQALSQAHEAQLRMLRYQLNPHFLFNTLNAISTLILEQDTRLANSMITRLSRFLRYSLEMDPMKRVTVREEIEALKLYLEIEQVRFGERLTLHFSIDPAVAGAVMPSMLLQPLVENAIKYAIAPSVLGGSIGVSAGEDNGCLLLHVADDGPGFDVRTSRVPKGSGVGLANIRERLRALYGENQSFRLGTTEPHGTTISISLPLQYDGAEQEVARG